MSRIPTDMETSAADGNVDALGILIETNMGLYVHIATSFMPNGADQSVMDDLVQEGLARIVKDIAKYNPHRGEWKYWSGMTCRKGVWDYLNKRHMTVRPPGNNEVHFTTDERVANTPGKTHDHDAIARSNEISRLLELVRQELPDAHEIVIRKMSGESFRGMKRKGLKMSRERASTLFDAAIRLMRSATLLDNLDIGDR